MIWKFYLFSGSWTSLFSGLSLLRHESIGFQVLVIESLIDQPTLLSPSVAIFRWDHSTLKLLKDVGVTGSWSKECGVHGLGPEPQ